jgi:hypothetical protein
MLYSSLWTLTVTVKLSDIYPVMTCNVLCNVTIIVRTFVGNEVVGDFVYGP